MRICGALVIAAALPAVLFGQSEKSQPPAPNNRIFWIIPNNRSSASLAAYKPLSAGAKFSIATRDTFDFGTVLQAAFFAGEGQLTNASPAFGQGVAGYARYFGTNFANFGIGNYMTEAIYPSLLHQDPRYFRRGTGSALSRVGYAMSQIFRTHTDAGRSQFNYSEILGNSTAVAISNAYYPDNRNAESALSSFGIQIGLDMAGNILKEFWPDLSRKLSHKGHPAK